jgi:hypothetical protein
MDRLKHAAEDERWRVREMVAAGLQRMLQADWNRTCAVLLSWASSESPLIVRAAVAAVAEPPLLKADGHGEQALVVQQRAVQRLAAIPPAERRRESVRVLRQALGYSISVVTVATPQTGFLLLLEMASAEDPDWRWIVAENLRKNRLKPWPSECAQLRAVLNRRHDPA